MGCSDKLILSVEAIGGSVIVLMGRVTSADAPPTTLVQDDVDSVRVDVCEIDEDGELTPVNSTGVEITDGSAYAEPSVASTVYNSLQTDSRWTSSPRGDSTGYNTAYKFVPPTRDTDYDVRITLTLANGDTLVLPFEVTAR